MPTDNESDFFKKMEVKEGILYLKPYLQHSDERMNGLSQPEENSKAMM